MENHDIKIIQWNCNGIRGKMEIKMLLSKYNPNILCIQETRLLQSLVVNFNNYSIFRYDHTGGETASQGLITLVKKCHYVNRINIQSTLQAIAIQTYNFLTICNIYTSTHLTGYNKQRSATSSSNFQPPSSSLVTTMPTTPYGEAQTVATKVR
ncbi:uncharacterized protein LOC113473349 isoform X2 [Diaphorina citri]|uniref:Uncharacterized protein LOC113473349 isoform X1 n=1 Tax=Diaphorina citri TaxID=121845 RepID=A0A3Q0JNM9_DIACI|nr:uncharacterized protein LOC113473349 isoform X1 [Diaphorina citri]XP_026688824.1 uncharacterized protein LOC113473349 isoform X2 [Diaphorina citri]